METLALLQPLALSLAIGLMIGLQRGWQTRDAPAGHRVAGFRTFGLLGFAGGLAALLPIAFGAILMAATAATPPTARRAAPSTTSCCTSRSTTRCCPR